MEELYWRPNELSREIGDVLAALKTCVKHKDLHKGTILHADILKRGLLLKNPNVASALVNMYAKCGVLAKASEVFEELSVQDVVSWNALIAGYVQHGQGTEALTCFERMQNGGSCPNVFTFMCALKSCCIIGATEKGNHIHKEILKQGILGQDIWLDTTLVDMYIKCGALEQAVRVHDELPVRNGVSWSALIAGHAHRHGKGALDYFEQMQYEGLSPNSVIFISVLTACGNLGESVKGKQIHEEIARKGLLEKDIKLDTALMDMYAKCGELIDAVHMFDKLPDRDIVAWSALIAGFTQHGQSERALKSFVEMHYEGVCPNNVTFIHILHACADIQASDEVERVHAIILNGGSMEKDTVLGNTLINMYASCGLLAKAVRVLDELPVRDAASWSALIAGYAGQGQVKETMNFFEQMEQEGVLPDRVTFLGSLKACTGEAAVDLGAKVHQKIEEQGLLGKETAIMNALLDMYVRCGELTKATELFDKLPVHDDIAWNTLIAGYAEQGFSEEALKYVEQMQYEGFFAGVVTFICLLKVCGATQAIDKGNQLHHEILRHGLLENNIRVGNALVDMFVDCGAIDQATHVLEELPVRDAVSWCTLIAGYVQQGHGVEALNCFKQMQSEGFDPDTVTFISMLKACGSIGALSEGKEMHDMIMRQGLLEKDIVLGLVLLDMYLKCSALVEAVQLFDGLPIHDVIAWNTIISGHIEEGQHDEALKYFEQMQSEGFYPDIVTFICIIKACGSIRALVKGEQIHHDIVRLGLLVKDIALGNILVDMYGKCGALVKAEYVFEELPVHDMVSWSSLIAGYDLQGQGEGAICCFKRMLFEGILPDRATLVCILKACGHVGAGDSSLQICDDIASQGLLADDPVLGNALVAAYAKCGAIAKAAQVLDDLPLHDIVTWGALIAEFTQQMYCEEALVLFERMQHEGVFPNAATFSFILRACGFIQAVARGEEIHREVARQRLLGSDVAIGSSLVRMYASCSLLSKAVQVLDDAPVRDVVMWSTLITGYTQQGHYNEALSCFEQMQCDGLSPDIVALSCISKACGIVGADKIMQWAVDLGFLETDAVLGNALLSVYAKCGASAKAAEVLDALPVRDIATWNALIAGCAHQKQGQEALKYFKWMQREDFSADIFSFISMLKACGSIGAIGNGKEIHDTIVKCGLLKGDIALGTTLVDMYAKCGAFTEAVQMLDELPVRNAVTWSALIAGFARQGQGDIALKCFKHMQDENVFPDTVTFICVLTACSCCGFLIQSTVHFATVHEKYGITPDEVHYICIVGLYSHVGELDKAIAVIKKMPSSYCLPAWLVLLGACHGYGNVQLGKFAFDNTTQLDSLLFKNLGSY